jgi:hypothetical protein
MPRFLVDRVWDPMDEAAMNEKAALSARLIEAQFPDIVWEHSHVVMDDEGVIHTFCVYEAPNSDRVREHAGALGQHKIKSIVEIAGDISPLDYPV